MGRYRDRLADKIKIGYSGRTIFWSYFIVVAFIAAIILLVYFNQ